MDIIVLSFVFLISMQALISTLKLAIEEKDHPVTVFVLVIAIQIGCVLVSLSGIIEKLGTVI